ncbi:MAG TPA: glycoside hydrolase 100 family protein [Bryobacteraceae bacterium]|nr:glycoside hydrolase 100 family protein [Bryobacteraceae bacterium]
MDRIREAAIDSLRRCCTPSGLKASGGRVGHNQVWARDSMMALLGARLVSDDDIRMALSASLETLRRAQSATGAIPNNVDVTTGRANFRAYADAGLWWIIGSSQVQPDLPSIRAILRWYESQDVDHSGLLSMQEGSDWQDLFCTRGKGLYLNCLYVLALQAAARAAAKAEPSDTAAWLLRAEHVGDEINRYFWYRGDGDMLRHISHTFSTESKQAQDALGRRRWLPVKRRLVDERYYLPYLGFRAAGEWFDCLGNLLAVLSGVANAEQSAVILDFIHRQKLNTYPLPALFPPVEPGDADWRDYYGMLNVPHHYHNGGIWPFIGGFYVAALVHSGRASEARESLARLEELNAAGHFNEWHSGLTAEPMGVEHQAWSAGMYLFAAECVRSGAVRWS